MRSFGKSALHVTFLAAVTVAAFAVGCGSSDDNGGSGGNNNTGGSAGQAGGAGGSAQTGDITIGVLQTLTGTDSSLGKTLQKSAKVAEQHINGQGGILGKKVKFDIEDDTNNKDKTNSLADAFIKAGVAGVLGATTSGMTTAIHQKFYDAKMLLISAGATTPTLSTAQPAKDRYFFRTVPTSVIHGRALAKLAYDGPPASASPREHFDCRKAAVIYTDNAYGKPYAENFEKSFKALGGSIAGTPVTIPKDAQANYDTEVGKLMAAKPECVIMVSYVEAAGKFLKDWSAATEADTSYEWGKVIIYGGNTFNSPDLIKEASVDPSDASTTKAEGVYGINIDIAPKTTEFSEFRNMYSAAYSLDKGENPPRNAANQFDAALVMALAIQKAGGYEDRVALRDALYSVSKGGKAYGPSQFGEAITAIKNGEDVDYNGASGPVDFSDTGDVVTDFIVWGVQNHEMKTLAEIPAKDLTK